jgi:hypothetical protein
MKKTDIAMIIFIATVSIIAAFLLGRLIFGETYNAKVTIKTIERINSNIVEPNSKIFNKDAINPTVQVEINKEAS